VLAMTYDLTDDSEGNPELMVSAMASGCNCWFAVLIDTELRMQCGSKPKNLYAMAEKMLEESGKVKTVVRKKSNRRELVCKEHNNK
jgi:hypothetical protein